MFQLYWVSVQCEFYPLPVITIMNSCTVKHLSVKPSILHSTGHVTNPPSCSASTATIVRIFYLNSLVTTQDFLWNSTPVAVWSIIEPGFAITASSIAFLKRLLRALMPRGNTSGSPKNRSIGWVARSIDRCELGSLGTGKGKTTVEARVKEDDWVPRN
jgi:hypothetical protein